MTSVSELHYGNDIIDILNKFKLDLYNNRSFSYGKRINKFDEFGSQLNSFCFFFRKECWSCQFLTN